MSRTEINCLFLAIVHKNFNVTERHFYRELTKHAWGPYNGQMVRYIRSITW